MNIWHDISPKEITKDSFTAVIEIPKGSKVKYELDKATGLLRIDSLSCKLRFYSPYLCRGRRSAGRFGIMFRNA